MPYPTAHILMSFGGPLYGAGEEWSNSLRLLGVGAEGDGAQEADQTACEAYADVIKTWFDASALISQSANLGWVKYNRVATTGLYKHPYTNVKDFAPVVVPNGPTTYNVAPQLALVATLRTAAKRGLAHAGRIYLPVPVSPLEGDGRLHVTNQTAWINSVKSLLDNIHALDTAQYVGVASKVDAGLMRRVTRVEIGRVYDTMRSRRTKLSEDYQGADLSTP